MVTHAERAGKAWMVLLKKGSNTFVVEHMRARSTLQLLASDRTLAGRLRDEERLAN